MKTNSPKIVLILTACIDPSNSKNRWLVLTDAKTRFLQYKDALEFYYLETKCPIIFIDNSGYDATELEEKYRGGELKYYLLYLLLK